jgi:hypothetical protein
MKRILISTVLAGCLCYPAFSGTIYYSVTGAFPASGTPVTPYSTNGASFEFDFSLPDMPVPGFSGSPGYFSIAVPVSYKLGATAFAPQTIDVFFFTSGWPISGGLQISPFPFTDPSVNAVTYIIFGSQLFSGTSSAPTLIPGTLAIDNASIQIDTAGGPGFGFAVPSTLVATAAPEPTSLGLAALALVAGAISGLKRRSRKSPLGSDPCWMPS